jgi:hypothetical protein
MVPEHPRQGLPEMAWLLGSLVLRAIGVSLTAAGLLLLSARIIL